MRYKKDPFTDPRPKAEEGRRLKAQGKCMVLQTGSETNVLITEVLGLLPWGSSR